MNKQIYLSAQKRIEIVKRKFISSSRTTQKWSWNRKNNLLCFLLFCFVLIFQVVWSIEPIHAQSKTPLGENITKILPSLQSMALGIDNLCPEIQGSIGATEDLGDRCSELIFR